MTADEPTKHVYLLAYPAGHSVSPPMHNAAFAALGMGARYQAREVAPAALAEAVASLRAPEVLGANVTIPHKQAVLPLLDEVAPEAQAVGAVNTIVNRDGRLWGTNTDVGGFLRAALELGVELRGLPVVVLGAGGAARAVVYALLRAGVRQLTLHNRTVARAQQLVRDLAGTRAAAGEQATEIVVVEDAELPAAVAAAELLVNTTSVGMAHPGSEVTEASPLPPGVLPRRGAVIDLIYRPPETKLLRDAAAAGLVTQNGLPMLVYQGAESFTWWTGVEPDVTVMLAAARAALTNEGDA